MSTPTRLCSGGAVSRPPRSQKTTYNTTCAGATYSKCIVPPQPRHCQSPVATLPASTAAIGLRRPSLRSARRYARRPQRQPLAPRRMRCRWGAGQSGFKQVHVAHDHVPCASKQRWWTALIRVVRLRYLSRVVILGTQREKRAAQDVGSARVAQRTAVRDVSSRTIRPQRSRRCTAGTPTRNHRWCVPVPRMPSR